MYREQTAFSYRAASTWNRLPSATRAHTVGVFRQCLRRWIVYTLSCDMCFRSFVRFCLILCFLTAYLYDGVPKSRFALADALNK